MREWCEHIKAAIAHQRSNAPGGSSDSEEDAGGAGGSEDEDAAPRQPSVYAPGRC